MARVRVMMMQRDESLLIDAWLRYYGFLFGFENLTVFDNGSADPAVIRSLRLAERAGVDLRWTHREPSDFVHKGGHFRNVMEAWRNEGLEYDFALPIDCDEFLAVFSRTGLECARSAIHRGFDGLVGEERACGIGTSLLNVFGAPGRFIVEAYPKSFLPAHAAAEIDHGFHHVRSSLAEGTRSTPFTTLHFRHKPLWMLRQGAVQRISAFTGSEAPDALAAHDGPSAHLVRLLGMSDAEYRHEFEERVMLEYQEFGHLLGALGIDSGFLGSPVDEVRPIAADQVGFVLPGAERRWFDGAAYLAANPDVAATDWPAALHYARHGAPEGRDPG